MTSAERTHRGTATRRRPDADDAPERARSLGRRSWLGPAAALLVVGVGGLLLAGVPIWTIGLLGLVFACVGVHLLIGLGGDGGHESHGPTQTPGPTTRAERAKGEHPTRAHANRGGDIRR